MKFYTIGLYGSTEKSYFNKLLENKIDLFCDIRQRRGVRGKEYSYVNSNKLQKKLHDLKIEYLYIKELAPTKEIRDKQKQDDIEKNILKRDRNKLGDKFISDYNSYILNSFNFDELMKYFKDKDFENIVFFCVEKEAAACHRSLVASKLHKDFNQMILDL